jgi:acetylornithine/succinyldiaminopimelate/putrescine aminotransferase
VDTLTLTQHYLIPTYARAPVAFVRGEGAWVWDESGRRYLDFACGIAVCSLGHCHPRLVEAVRRQAGLLWHVSNLYHIPGQAELAQVLTERVVGLPGKCFFCNSGAESNEALVKLARKFGHATAVAGAAPRFEVVTFTNSFHGRTMAGIAATGQDKVKTGFAPHLEGFRHVPFNDPAALRAAVSERTVAVMLEPVQGEGGINVASREFLEEAAALRDEFGLLLLIDEVQSGLGRTGDLCSWRSVAPGVVPDAVSWAKGLGGGFPIGGIWVRDRPVRGTSTALCDLLGPGSHGTTFGGTPLASAAALAVVGEILDRDLAAHAAATGRRVVDGVATWGPVPALAGVRGLGLLIGFQIDAAVVGRCPGFAASGLTAAGYVSRRLLGAGLLTVPAAGDAVRWLPPLNVAAPEIDEALAIMHRVLREIGDEAA